MTIAQIMWANSTEMALKDTENGNNMAMTQWYQRNVEEISHLIAKVRRKDLSKLHHRIIVALVTTDVHARDIIETLKNEKVNTTNNFTWQQQLRFEWNESIDDVLVRQANSEINYGYEYENLD